jgi:hypothetical protein
MQPFCVSHPISPPRRWGRGGQRGALLSRNHAIVPLCALEVHELRCAIGVCLHALRALNGVQARAYGGMVTAKADHRMMHPVPTAPIAEPLRASFFVKAAATATWGRYGSKARTCDRAEPALQRRNHALHADSLRGRARASGSVAGACLHPRCALNRVRARSCDRVVTARFPRGLTGSSRIQLRGGAAPPSGGGQGSGSTSLASGSALRSGGTPLAF